jgi:hypothetical protein
MCRIGKNSAIKLRLNEINRMSVELSATSSELANLAADLNELRQLIEIGIFADRQAYASRQRQGEYSSRKHPDSSRP